MKKSIYKYSLKREKVMEFRENEHLNMPEKAYRFLKAIRLHEEEQEHMIALILDTAGKIKAYYTVSIGLIGTSQIHIRELCRNAILYGASRIIIAHNLCVATHKLCYVEPLFMLREYSAEYRFYTPLNMFSWVLMANRCT